jgi:hypothetical protein
LLQTLSRNKERTLIFCLVGIYLLLACLWQDIAFYDESYYLDRGTQIHASMFLHELTEGPLYSLWFRVLAFVCPNPVWRFFFSWGLLVTIVATIPWLMRIRSAWIYALILFCVPFFSVGPYVSLFASMFLVIGLCLILRYDLPIVDALVLSCTLCFVAAFCRPEFEYGVFVSGAVAVVAIMAKGFHESQRRAVFAILLILCLMSTMLVAIRHSDQSRSGLAFVQHFNIRASQKGLLGGESPPLSLYAYKVFHVTAGRKATIGAFFRSNPRLFFGHLAANAADPKFFLPLIVLLAVIAYTWLTKKDRSLLPASIFILMISVPVVVGSLVIYPRRHYAVIAFPAVVLFALQVFMPRRAIRTVSVPWLLILATALIVAKPLLKRQIPNKHSGLLTIQCLRDLEASKRERSSTMFDSIGIPNVYFASPKVHGAIFDLTDLQSFKSWASQTRPDWILAGPEMEMQYHISPEQLNELATGEMGYVPHACPAATGLTVYTLPNR